MPASPRVSTVDMKWATSPRVRTASILELARNETMPNVRYLNEARANVWLSIKQANKMLNEGLKRSNEEVKSQKTLRLNHLRTTRPNWGVYDYRPVAESLTGYQGVLR